MKKITKKTGIVLLTTAIAGATILSTSAVFAANNSGVNNFKEMSETKIEQMIQKGAPGEIQNQGMSGIPNFANGEMNEENKPELPSFADGEMSEENRPELPNFAGGEMSEENRPELPNFEGGEMNEENKPELPNFTGKVDEKIQNTEDSASLTEQNILEILKKLPTDVINWLKSLFEKV